MQAVEGLTVITGTITTETALHIGTGLSKDIVKQTRSYIPGSVLRGTVGLALVKTACTSPEYADRHEECPEKDGCPYFQLFRDEANKASNVIFRHGYPRHLGCGHGGTYIPTPRTLYVCTKCETRYNTYQSPPNCSCGGDLKQFSGYVCNACNHITRSPIVDYVTHKPSLQRVTQTAINRSHDSIATIRRQGQEPYGTMHSRDLIPKGTRFSLQVLAYDTDENAMKALRNVLEKAVADEGLGGGKSRGLGKVDVRIEKVEVITPGQIDKDSERIDEKDFTVRCLSAALLEKAALPPATLLASARRAYTRIYHLDAPSLPDIDLKEQRVELETFSGWSLKSDRRRAILPAASAGSVYRYASPADITLRKALSALEYLAIGQYKSMGQGQVAIEMIT